MTPDHDPATPTPTETPAALPALDSASIPRATYRLQFHGGFRFDDARRLVPYLRDLGVSHLYASPYLKARAGSTHGYDIVDHNALNPEIGDEAAFDALCDALREHGLKQLVDVVPNHMGVLEADNAWWLDVLENGAASPHAATFDIDWTPTAADMEGQVLLPVLGAQYGEVLEAGELELRFDGTSGEFRVDYYDHRLPIDPRDYARVLGVVAPPDLATRALVERFAALPRRDDVALADGQEDTVDPNVEAEKRLQRDARSAAAREAKAALAQLCADSALARDWLRRCLDAFRGRAGEPDSFDRLDALLQRQPWRLAHWRVAGDEINYRRFFDVNTLAAIRIERRAVFDATHRTLLRWLDEGRLDGLRIDHPDGLADPQRYFERLQRAWVDAQRARDATLAPRALYVVIEKILAEHEHWPADWPVHGDTGYRFANLVNGLFVDTRNAEAFDALYDAFVARRVDYEHTLVDAKRDVMSRTLAADLHMLAERAYRIAQGDRRTRDFTRNGLRRALRELAAAFPVYRTYIDERGVHDIDRRHLDWAAALARRRGQALEPTALQWLRDLMLGAPAQADPARRDAVLRLVRRFQQFTPPVTAKAMEDTAFYRYHRLISLNEVGGDPRLFGTSVAAFHAANQARQRHLPHTLLGTSTHDSKRSEDVRARIDVLSEMPAAWRDAIGRWHEMNQRRAERVEGDAEIDANDEFLLYQTLVGVWPLGPVDDAALARLRQRVQDYMRKAVREAKERTSWVDPDADHEAALTRFIDTLLGVLEPNPFLTDLRAFVASIAPFGACNSLVQVAFKLTAPGVPDLYQGCEGWSFHLVDPDNRQPVDFDARREALASLSTLWRRHGGVPAAELRRLREHTLHDGRLKLLLTWRLLQLRRRCADVYAQGRYVPLAVQGRAESHVVAYARECGAQQHLVIGARLLHTLAGGDATALFGGERASALWGDTQIVLPEGGPDGWVDVLTGQAHGGELRLAGVLSELPVAVLVPAADWPALRDDGAAQTTAS